MPFEFILNQNSIEKAAKITSESELVFILSFNFLVFLYNYKLHHCNAFVSATVKPWVDWHV